MVVRLRGSGLTRFCAVGMLFAGMLCSAPPAAADDAVSCQKGSDDVAIAACSRLIASGRFSARNLGTLYFNRGIAYKHKGQYDRAIQDYDQAIRLNPRQAEAFSSRGTA
jgi:lipoprotein NlpI